VSSGVEVDSPLAMIIEFRDDKASSLRAYLDHDEALKAVRLAD